MLNTGQCYNNVFNTLSVKYQQLNTKFEQSLMSQKGEREKRDKIHIIFEEPIKNKRKYNRETRTIVCAC